MRKIEIKKRKIEETHRWELARKTKLTDRIIYYGIWQTKLEIEDIFKSLTNLPQIAIPLRFSWVFFKKHVLKQCVSD